jgi:hypothetical protein
MSAARRLGSESKLAKASGFCASCGQCATAAAMRPTKPATARTTLASSTLIYAAGAAWREWTRDHHGMMAGPTAARSGRSRPIMNGEDYFGRFSGSLASCSVSGFARFATQITDWGPWARPRAGAPSGENLNCPFLTPALSMLANLCSNSSNLVRQTFEFVEPSSNLH